MQQLPENSFFVVDESNEAAHTVMRKLCERPPKPGQVTFVTHEEFEALRGWVIAIPITHYANRHNEGQTAIS